MWRFFTDINSLSANPTKWSNTFKQFRRIVWVCLTILWGWHLKCSKHYFHLRFGVMHLVSTQNFLKRLIFLIHISCSYQEVRKISFSENFTYVLKRSSLTTFPKKQTPAMYLTKKSDCRHRMWTAKNLEMNMKM